jgi:hypothetical protein
VRARPGPSGAPAREPQQGRRRPAARALAALALVAFALALSGCETTAERSAALERVANERRRTLSSGLSISHPSTTVRVTSTTFLHDAEGGAAVITMRNLSGRAEQAIPIAVTVKDADGRTLYANNAPGLARSLVSIAYLPARAELTWVDDQAAATGQAASVTAQVGAASPVGQPAPALAVSGTHLFEDPTNGLGAEGTVSNRSSVQQQELVLYVVARRGGRIVAAGRAVVPVLAPGGSTRFQAFFVGDPAGAQLQVSAPPTTLG